MKERRRQLEEDCVKEELRVEELKVEDEVRQRRMRRGRGGIRVKDDEASRSEGIGR